MRPRRSRPARRGPASPRPGGRGPSVPTLLAQGFRAALPASAPGPIPRFRAPERFRGTRCPAPALRVQANIVGIAASLRPRIRIDHPRRARIAIKQSAQQGQVFVPQSATGKRCGVSDQILYALPCAGCENGGVFARIRLSLMPDRTRIQNVGQQPPQRIQRKRPAGTELT